MSEVAVTGDDNFERIRGIGPIGDLLEGLTDGVVVIDRDRRVKAFNSSYAKVAGLGGGAIRVGDRLECLLRVLAARGGLDADMSPEAAVERRLAMWGTPEDRQCRRHLANGRVLDILRSTTADGDIISVTVDVTESLQRERELELQRIYTASILDNITDGVALVDASGRYIAFNRVFLEQFEIDPARVRWGMSVDALYPEFGDLARLTEDARQRAIAERKSFLLDPGRTTVTRRMSTGRVIRVTKALLPGGGCVLTTHDRTEAERHEAEIDRARHRAEEVSRHKSQFLARMSHEMRTPLNGVLGVAAILRTTDLDPRQRELADVIASSGEMLLRLIDDVLDLSRIEAGSIELRAAPFRPCDPVRDCLDLMAPRAREKGLTLTAESTPDPAPLLLGDRVRMQQVVLNLVSNAVKFTAEGGVYVALRADRDDAVCTTRITVSDTGVGIPDSLREFVFEQFYQVDGSDTRSAGGAGLGLTITRRLVEAMDGRIEVSARPGGGSVFDVTLTLPLAGAGGAQARRPACP